MKVRIKTHQMPGDVPKQEKQAMLEDRPTDRKLSHEVRKKYKKGLLLRERAILKERTRHLIRNNED